MVEAVRRVAHQRRCKERLVQCRGMEVGKPNGGWGWKWANSVVEAVRRDSRQRRRKERLIQGRGMEVDDDDHDDDKPVWPTWAVDVLSDDDDNKPVWPTWAVGALFSGVRRIHINHCIGSRQTQWSTVAADFVQLLYN